MHIANTTWHTLSSNHIVDVVHDAFTLSYYQHDGIWSGLGLATDPRKRRRDGSRARALGPPGLQLKHPLPEQYYSAYIRTLTTHYMDPYGWTQLVDIKCP